MTTLYQTRETDYDWNTRTGRCHFLSVFIYSVLMFGLWVSVVVFTQNSGGVYVDYACVKVDDSSINLGGLGYYYTSSPELSASSSGGYSLKLCSGGLRAMKGFQDADLTASTDLVGSAVPVTMRGCKDTERMQLSTGAILFWVGAVVFVLTIAFNIFWYYIFYQETDPFDERHSSNVESLRRFFWVPLRWGWLVSMTGSAIYVVAGAKIVAAPKQNCPGMIHATFDTGYYLMAVYLGIAVFSTLLWLCKSCGTGWLPPPITAGVWQSLKTAMRVMALILVFAGFIVAATVTNINLAEQTFKCNYIFQGKASPWRTEPFTLSSSYGDPTMHQFTATNTSDPAAFNCTVGLGAFSNISLELSRYIESLDYLIPSSVLTKSDQSSSKYFEKWKLVSFKNDTAGWSSLCYRNFKIGMDAGSVLFWLSVPFALIVCWPLTVFWHVRCSTSTTWDAKSTFKIACLGGLGFHYLGIFLILFFTPFFVELNLSQNVNLSSPGTGRIGSGCPGLVGMKYGYGYWFLVAYTILLSSILVVRSLVMMNPCQIFTFPPFVPPVGGGVQPAPGGTNQPAAAAGPPPGVPLEEFQAATETKAALEGDLDELRRVIADYRIVELRRSQGITPEGDTMTTGVSGDARPNASEQLKPITKQFLEELAEVMECPICFAMYGENDSAVPVTFSCGHSCCAEHIHQLRGKCPKCRAALPEDSAALKPAIALRSCSILIAKMLEAAEKVPPSPSAGGNNGKAQVAIDAGSTLDAQGDDEDYAFGQMRAFSEAVLGRDHRAAADAQSSSSSITNGSHSPASTPGEHEPAPPVFNPMPDGEEAAVEFMQLLRQLRRQHSAASSFEGNDAERHSNSQGTGVQSSVSVTFRTASSSSQAAPL